MADGLVVSRPKVPASSEGMTTGYMGGNMLALTRADKDEKGIPQLTPGLWKRGVSSGGIVNYVYNIIYTVAEYFSPGVTKRHVLQTLIKTRDAYRDKIKEVEKAYDRVHGYLEDLSEGKSVDKVEIAGAISVVLDYLDAVGTDDGVTFKKLVKQANQAYDSVIKDAREEPWFDEVMGDHKSSGWLPFGNDAFPYDDRISRIQRRRDLLDLIENVGTPLPVSAFRKLSAGVSALTTLESEGLKTWIAEVNGSWRMDVRRLHRGLRGLFEHLDISSVCKQGKVSRLAMLESELVSRGVSLLLKEDRKHMRWRDGINSRDVLEAKGRRYVLDKQLGEHRSSSSKDKHVVYSVKDNDEVVVVMPMNEAIVGIEQATAIGRPGAAGGAALVPMADLKRMDRFGRFAIYERLTTPLVGHNWNSGDAALDNDDRTTLTPVVTLLQAMLQREKTPKISAKDFMIGSDGTLKLLRGQKEGADFDYDLLVQFCLDAANGSLAVFKHLLTGSGIRDHALRQFYKDIVNDSLAGAAARGVDAVAAARSISEPKVRERAKKLRDDIVRTRDWCCTQYMQRYDANAGMPRSALEALFHNLFNYYDNTIGAGVLWPGLGEDLLVAVAAAGMLKLTATQVEKIYPDVVAAAADDAVLKARLKAFDADSWRKYGVVNDDQRQELGNRL